MDKEKCIEIIRSAVQNGSHPGAPSQEWYQSTSVIALFVFGEEIMLLFIQKADKEGYPWAGQMAFPGGHVDKTDATARETALRELEEEMGISRDNVEVLGSLGHFQTINDKDIEAWVGIWNGQEQIRFDTQEISRVFRIPLKYLMDLHKEKGFDSVDHPPNVMWLKYPFEDVLIWGVTAKILYHLLELLRKA
jgi:coenzyme A diphosphatase NUDT7